MADHNHANVASSIYDFRNAMASVLTPLFDGNSHYLGDTQRVIPSCKVVVVHDTIEPPTELSILIVGDSAVYDMEKYKTTDPSDATKRAIEYRGMIERSVFVVTPLGGMEPGKRMIDIDNVWSCLFAIFSTRSQQFIPYGIFFPNIQILPTDIRTKALFIEAHGTLRAQIRTYYRPYTTNL